MEQKDLKNIEAGSFIMNPFEQTVFSQGLEIPFTNREFQVLYLLLENRGQVFSKWQIYRQVSRNYEKEDYHTIEITISRIRKKLELYTGEKNLIITIRGRGYKFKK